MKIDFEMLETMEAAGAPAKAIIAYLRRQFEREEAKKIVKRPKDAKRKRERLAATSGGKRATESGNVATASDPERLKATLDDSPRARLFRECVPALIALNMPEGRARSLLASWLKMTNDDDQLVTAAVMRARDKQAVDVPGYVLAILKEKTGNGQRPHHTQRRSGANDFFAGLAEVASDLDRDGAVARPADPDIPRGRFEIDGSGTA